MGEAYQKYILSPEWKERSNSCIKHYNNRCFCCNKPYDLQAHHLTYRHFKNERIEDLVCLCKTCHEWIEDRKKEHKNRHNAELDNWSQKALLQERRNKYNDGTFQNVCAEDYSHNFLMACLKNDLCCGGKYNLGKIEDFNHFRAEYQKENGEHACGYVNISRVREFLNPYRYKVILEYLDRKYPAYITVQRTRFTPAQVHKVYNDPDKYRNRVIKALDGFNGLDGF